MAYWSNGQAERVYPQSSKTTYDEPLLLSLQLGPSPSIEQDEVWVLLSKHTDTGIEEEYLSLQVREDLSFGYTPSLPVDLEVSTGICSLCFIFD